MLSCQGISPEGKSVAVSGENGSAGPPIRISQTGYRHATLEERYLEQEAADAA